MRVGSGLPEDVGTVREQLPNRGGQGKFPEKEEWMLGWQTQQIPYFTRT